MYWKVKDKISYPDELATILTMDHFVASMFEESYTIEHRMRDTAIEYGMEATKQRLELEEVIYEQLKKDNITPQLKYRLFGLWLMNQIHINDKGLGVSKGQLEEKVDEEEVEEEGSGPVVQEDAKVVEKKRREYTR